MSTSDELIESSDLDPQFDSPCGPYCTRCYPFPDQPYDQAADYFEGYLQTLTKRQREQGLSSTDRFETRARERAQDMGRRNARRQKRDLWQAND